MDIIEILGKVGFDSKSALFNLINFLVVLAILKIFLFGKIGNIIEERKKMVQKSMDDAEQVKTELAMAEQKAAEVISEAKKEGNEIIKKSQDDAKTSVDRLKADAHLEADQIKEKAKIAAEKEKEDMLERLRDETAELTLLATEHILAEKVSPEQDKKIIDKFLENLAK